MKSVSGMIKEIKDSVVRNLNPEKIILFGSSVRRNSDKNSDIDLFIVKETDLDMHRRMVEARDAIPYNYPVDVIVYTPEEFEKYRDNKWSFLYRILRHGEIIYERK